MILGELFVAMSSGIIAFGYLKRNTHRESRRERLVGL